MAGNCCARRQALWKRSKSALRSIEGSEAGTNQNRSGLKTRSFYNGSDAKTNISKCLLYAAKWWHLPGHGKSGQGQNFSCLVWSCLDISAILVSSIKKRDILDSSNLRMQLHCLSEKFQAWQCFSVAWYFAYIFQSLNLVEGRHTGKPGSWSTSACRCQHWSNHIWRTPEGTACVACLPISNSETLRKKYTSTLLKIPEDIQAWIKYLQHGMDVF